MVVVGKVSFNPKDVLGHGAGGTFVFRWVCGTGSLSAVTMGRWPLPTCRPRASSTVRGVVFLQKTLADPLVYSSGHPSRAGEFVALPGARPSLSICT